MNSVWEVIPLIGLFIMIAFIFKIVVDHRIRSKLIDKGMLDENVKYLYKDGVDVQILSSLKWGMILIGIGLAIFVGQIVPEDLAEEVTIGAMFLFAGLGLLLYYFIAYKVKSRFKEKSSEM
ncbi:MAG: hypothetical protein AMJ90_08075 [candidate division Zixibacteria bacterium SM23_73_2]|nr:MAG: hypothetical protein AMJ90_08075 [candidate division Zixibacteria bacterium SM23_73_2]